jgi:VIT1/CCC1 family predicted Fe2+/Mn2+ transporter
MNEERVHKEGSYIRDAVFAASDGLVTTFAVVAGSFGASFGTNVVIILGFANLLADGLSMSSGTYMGVKSEMDFEKGEGDKHLVGGSPVKQGLITFGSFVIAGFIPLIPYVVNLSSKFFSSLILVFISMFVIGMVRGRFTKKSWYKSGLETLLIGGMSALSAYFIGFAIDKWIL